jgi:HK97 gp10 family phage protein
MGKVHLKTSKILTDRCEILSLSASEDVDGQKSGALVSQATNIPCRLLPLKAGKEYRDEKRDIVADFTIYLMPWPSYADQQLTEHHRIKINNRIYDIVLVMEPVLEGLPTDAKWEFNFRTQSAKKKTQDAIYRGIQETFEVDIKAEAKRGSPVLTGNNRRSIDTEVSQQENGVLAELFTQSGYGGYLELGTVKMEARPYLWPAFQKFRKKLGEQIGRNIRVLRNGSNG